MATLTTKYNIGDVVWYASTRHSTKRLPCPDCLGQREWQAISPAGRGYLFACPRCSQNFQSSRDLSLDVPCHVPSVTRLTIGQVGWHNDHWDQSKSGPQYMCHETGIGSGSQYYEHTLFDTEEEALRVAEAKADEISKNILENPNYYWGHLKVCDYQIDVAAVKAAERKASAISYDFQDFGNNVADLLEETWLSRDELARKLRKLIGDQWADHPAVESEGQQ